MNKKVFPALFVAAGLLANLAPVSAADSMMNSHHMMGAMPAMVTMKMNSRFGGPGVYTGPPALGVTLAVVEAGGGPKNYSTMTLLKTLAGEKTDAEG